MKSLTHGAGLVAVMLVASVCAALPAAAQPSGSAAGPSRSDPGFQGENSRINDVDARAGTHAPTARQQDAAHGKGLVARWNRLGTPDSLSRPGGYLATGLSADPVTA